MDLIKEYGLEEDPRFKDTKKESIRYVISFIVLSIWVWIWAYIVAKQDPATYKWILGFPEWFFWAALAVEIIYPIWIIIQAIQIKDCNLSANGKEEL